jgi:phosphoglycolate phosphatase
MKQYELVVFDWEGTLADPLGHVLHIVSLEAQRLGLPTFDIALAHRCVSLGIDKAVARLFPGSNLYQQEQLLHAVQQTLSTHHQDYYLFPGAQALIAAIAATDIQLAIATNKNAASLRRALQATELDNFFRVTRSAGEVPPKPCPQMLEDIMAHVAITPSATLMIGDSTVDVEMARNAGVDAMGVDFYHQQADDLLTAGAITVVDDYQKIGHYLALPNY